MEMQDFHRLIDGALAKGDVAGAADLAETALAAGAESPLFLNLVAWKREDARDFIGAQALLDRALVLAPGDPHIWTGIGTLLRKQGRFDEAVSVLTQISREWPDISAAWLEQGYALEFSGALQEAIAPYARAAELDPGLAPPWAGLASVHARLRRIAEARDFATRALRIEAGNAAAHIALARCDGEERQFAAVVKRLEPLVRSLVSEDRILALGLLGEAHDGLAQTEAAYCAFAEANAVFSTVHTRAAGTETQRAFVERIAATIATLPPRDAPPASDHPAGHAFLLGFPRSGTTLVETILAGSEKVVSLEERPTLAAADRALLSESWGLADMASVKDADLGEFRDAYWQSVRSLGVDVAGKLFVDMDPLKGIKLPIIARLFPDAKIILMRRDPRDIVWSCFRTNFAPTAAAFEFISIEGAARHFDAVMRVTEASMARFPLATHIVRYDRLVSDFDGETQALCAFLGLEWTESLRQFDRTAAQQSVSTASATQVRRGLFDGRGQWRPYARYMDAALPILAPWVEAFGFEP